MASILLAPLSDASPKAGVGDVDPGAGCVDALGVRWYYNWGPAPKPAAARAEFVPMIWDGGQATKEIFGALAQGNPSGVLLGFNEPERKDQARMTVEEALRLWPALEGTGFRLGSPAVSLDAGGKEWLRRFMAEAGVRGLRVDFVCAHWYGDVTRPDAADSLRGEMEALGKEYGKPVWLTEFGAMDLYFKPGDDRAALTVRFLRGAIPMLDSLPAVERYAWFTTLPYESCRASALFAAPSRALTPAGEAYRALIR